VGQRVQREAGLPDDMLKGALMDPTDRNIIEQYQTGAVEALVLLRVKLWKDLAFEDLTPNVLSMIADLEDRIQRSRKALIHATAFDPGVTEAKVAKIRSEVVIPHETGRLKR
jgi:hypothetical protein